MELTQHTREYWKYEYDVCALFMIPLLRSWGVTLEGRSVLDVGCGEGGGLCALFDQGAVCVGFDIDEYRIQVARELQGTRTIGLTTGNLYAHEIPYAGRDFDLLVLHDVFEHLEIHEAGWQDAHYFSSLFLRVWRPSTTPPFLHRAASVFPSHSVRRFDAPSAPPS